MTTVFTVGHSTHPIEEFIGLLRAHGVARLIDVRTIAKSRHNPQFSEDAIAASLAAAGIGYQRMPDLGGLRHGTAHSPNGAWRNASFRGYADYMQTAAFDGAIEDLLRVAGAEVSCIMCAEVLPWRCHRSLIGDALLVRGVQVLDIVSPSAAPPHALTRFARVDGSRITYPPENGE
jgi:uncharacterized protein (DUF488 family)